jgi:hypothetical protein
MVNVVAGIVSYTRWPADAAPIRLCALGQGKAVDELLGTDYAGFTPAMTVRRAGNVADAGNECDAVYVGTLPLKSLRDVLRQVTGRPVLMVGEGSEFCTDGGMFCVDPNAANVRLTVNLDAVARSGLRVHPAVLRIARNAPASGP